MGLCALGPCSTGIRVAAFMTGIEYTGERVLRGGVGARRADLQYLRDLQYRSELPGYRERLHRRTQGTRRCHHHQHGGTQSGPWNIVGERLWRHVTHEDVSRKWYATKAEVQRGLKDDSVFDNTERIHQSLNDLTPDEVYKKTSGGGAWIVSQFVRQQPRPQQQK